MQKTLAQLAALWAGLGVIIGAFGSHTLRSMLEATERTQTFETAVRYQMYHALGLLGVSILLQFSKPEHTQWLRYSGISLMVGSFIFSVALYLICFTGVSTWGAIAPIGGLGMVLGWGFLLVWASKK